MAVVSFDEVSVRFGKTHAVRGVSLDIDPGEIMVLLGPSGCGKTTLLRALAGLQSIESGRIEGENGLLSDSKSEVDPNARGVGMVFQNLALWPHMTALQHLLFSRGESARDQDAVLRATGLLGEVGLKSLAERRPDELSGGEQQRLAVARALASEPAILLLDEPLSSLDPLVAVDLRRLLRQVNRDRGTTMIYVTHSQQEAFELGDKVALMCEGALLQVGTPEDLALRPASPFVAEFVGGGTVLECSLAADGEWSCSLGAFPSQCLLKGPYSVVLREQNLKISDGGSGTVVDSMFRGTHFTSVVAINGATVYCRDDRRRESGEKVSVTITGQPWVIGREGESS